LIRRALWEAKVKALKFRKEQVRKWLKLLAAPLKVGVEAQEEVAAGAAQEAGAVEVAGLSLLLAGVNINRANA
jgi:hypothetical protein